MNVFVGKIEKALECCSNLHAECNECVFYGNEWCRVTLAKESLRIINRLKAENKNCGVKIQCQREQLKACNEKIKEQQAEIERFKYINEREKQRQSEKAKDKVSSLGLLDDLLTKSYKENEELKAEIERLKSKVNRIKRYDEERDIRLHARLIATAKSEAVKEFWNELKRRNTLNPLIVSTITGDNLLKEMGCE
ncbi:MAG: hypothetical protein IJZ54_06945 [Clostridia bacterium]|nr:hypothetical protein [Clostridia bacterium]